MKPPRIRAAMAASASLLAMIPTASGDRLDDFADSFREATFLQSERGDLTFDTDLYLTSDTLITSRPAPGIYKSGGNVLASPRVSVLGQVDYGEKLTLFALGRADRGFDATDGVAKARPDEYYLRLDPFDGPMRFTVGKFGAAYGQWARRYLEWDNPMVTAPLAYEWVTTAGDGLTAPTVAPPVAGFLARKGREADRTRWAPIVWGPAYCSGFRIDGTVSRVDYAFEIKNNALSSRPFKWDLWDRGLNAAALTYQGRLGFRPVTDWNLGLSASSGSYLTDDSPGLPADTRWHEPTQDAVCLDLSWAHGPLEVWSELHWNRFDIPGPVGSVAMVSYFIESKWKFAPGWWLSGRWNQQLPEQITDPATGRRTTWDNEVWRIEACVGWQVNRTASLKAGYSFADQAGPISQGRDLAAFQVILGF